ncbi:MAG: S41 family peptidase [Spirochaetes bacterium]|nr:S41 family peptidase [Spirochaetota bacterium]
MKKYFLLVLVLLFIFRFSASQMSFVLQEKTDLNKYQKDFIEIIKQIETVHPGLASEPLPFMQEEEWQKNVTQVFNQLASSTTNLDFHLILKTFFSKLNDGHTSLHYQPVEGENLTLCLPIEVSWFGDELYVVNVFEDHLKDLLYKKVLSINDLSVIEFEQKINQMISVDKDNVYSIRKNFFGNSIYMTDGIILKYLGLLDHQNTLQLTYLDGEKQKIVKLTAIKDKYQHQYAYLCRNEVTQIKNRRQNHYQMIPELSTIYIQLNRLPYQVDRKFIKSIFKKAAKNEIENLVVDIRNNGGGNSAWCDELLKYIIKKPQELYIYKCYKRSGDKNQQIYHGIRKLSPKNKKLQFQGKLFLFTGGATFSSATFLAVAVKDNNLGQIIGQPCGNNSIRYGYLSSVDLPETGFTFFTSQRIWERALPGIIKKEKFITPHVYINSAIDDYINQEDPLWEYFVKQVSNN